MSESKSFEINSPKKGLQNGNANKATFLKKLCKRVHFEALEKNGLKISDISSKRSLNLEKSAKKEVKYFDGKEGINGVKFEDDSVLSTNLSCEKETNNKDDNDSNRDGDKDNNNKDIGTTCLSKLSTLLTQQKRMKRKQLRHLNQKLFVIKKIKKKKPNERKVGSKNVVNYTDNNVRNEAGIEKQTGDDLPNPKEFKVNTDGHRDTIRKGKAFHNRNLNCKSKCSSTKGDNLVAIFGDGNKDFNILNCQNYVNKDNIEIDNLIFEADDRTFSTSVFEDYQIPSAKKLHQSALTKKYLEMLRTLLLNNNKMETIKKSGIDEPSKTVHNGTDAHNDPQAIADDVLDIPKCGAVSSKIQSPQSLATEAKDMNEQLGEKVVEGQFDDLKLTDLPEHALVLKSLNGRISLESYAKNLLLIKNCIKNLNRSSSSRILTENCKLPSDLRPLHKGQIGRADQAATLNQNLILNVSLSQDSLQTKWSSGVKPNQTCTEPSESFGRAQPGPAESGKRNKRRRYNLKKRLRKRLLHQLNSGCPLSEDPGQLIRNGILSQYPINNEENLNCHGEIRPYPVCKHVRPTNGGIKCHCKLAQWRIDARGNDFCCPKEMTSASISPTRRFSTHMRNAPTDCDTNAPAHCNHRLHRSTASKLSCPVASHSCRIENRDAPCRENRPCSNCMCVKSARTLTVTREHPDEVLLAHRLSAHWR